MVTIGTPYTMSRNDFRASEKRWQHKRLFRKQRPQLVPRIVTLLVFLAVVAALVWWFKIPLFDFFTEQLALSEQLLS